MMWRYIPHAQETALQVEEIRTPVLGDDLDVTGLDPRSKVENINFIVSIWYINLPFHSGSVNLYEISRSFSVQPSFSMAVPVKSVSNRIKNNST